MTRLVITPRHVDVSVNRCPTCKALAAVQVGGRGYCAACARSMRNHLSPEPRALEDELADACRAALDVGRSSI